MFASPRNSVECRRARFRNSLVLLTRTTAYTDGADHLASLGEREPACEDHHAPFVRGMDAEELTARLRIFRKILRTDIESSRCECLLDGNIDAAEPRFVHAHVSNEMAAGICDRDIHGLTQFLCLPLRRGNDPAGVFQCDHGYLSQLLMRCLAPRLVRVLDDS